MACTCLQIKKEHLGSANFKYTFSCTNSAGVNSLVEIVSGNDNQAKSLAELECSESEGGVKIFDTLYPSYTEISALVESNKSGSFRKLVDSHINPLAAAGILGKLESEPQSAGGGGAQINAQGQRVGLGSSKCGANITVNIGGSAVVQIEMWFFLGSSPAGIWTVGGPGGQSFQLNCNVFTNDPFGCPNSFNQPVGIYALGISGNFPVWANFN